MMYSEVLGVGGYVPDRVVKNQDLLQWMDTSDEWIQQRSGIQERRWVDPSLGTSDLALKASEEALRAAGISAKDLDMIILGTLSPDYDFPGTSCFLQAKLGVPGIAILDIRQQCSAFLYGMSIADQFLRTGMYRNILVVGAEVHSKGIDRSTKGREVAVLFGDGAGAIVMTRRESQTSKPDRNASQVYTTKLHGDGSFAKELWMPGPMNAGGVEFRITHEMIERGDHFPKMNGKVVFLNAVKRMSEVLIEALDSSGYKLEDVDLFLFHQANLRINEMVASQLKIPAEKVFNTIQKFGNTTAATIPLGMSEAVKIGRLKKGDLVASAAFGSGFTWASAIFRY